MKIAFAKPYEECINKKETLRIMRQHLTFLSRYAYLVEEPEEEEVMVEEDTLLDYLPYTKSVIHVQDTPGALSQSAKLLMAIEKYDKQVAQKRKMRKERRLRCIWLMQGIALLPEEERKILLGKYVKHMNNEQIACHMGNISSSTINRILQRACLDLAQILEVEILK